MAFEEWFVAHARTSGKEHGWVTMDDKVTFFQQLGALIGSGMPLLQAIQTCAEQNQSRKLRAVLFDISQRLAAGCSLRDAMSDHRDVFPDHWTALVGMGEVSGKMDMVLADLNQQIRESRDSRQQIVSAMIYPAVLFMVALAVLVIMLWLVVPTFRDMFTEMGAELPGITKVVIAFSDVFANYGVFIVLGLIGVGFGVAKVWTSDVGRGRVCAVGLAIPVVGELLVQSAMYRFASNLSLLLRSGVPMLDTLAALTTIFRGSPVYAGALVQAQSRVAAGRPLADSLEETELFTTLMTNMVRVGEESSQLAPVMDQLAPYYRDKLNSFIVRATKMMEPLIIIVMGVVIAIVMMAIYMPMFDMAGAVR